MQRDESVYLRHILDAIARIEEYTCGVNEQAFRGRSLIQDGVIRQLEILGEAVKHLPAAPSREISRRSLAGHRRSPRHAEPSLLWRQSG
jgi:uncharacterized protein with HEPN domain